MKEHKTTILPPLSTTFVKGRSKVKGHQKRVNVATKQSDNITNSNIAAVRRALAIKPGSNKVVVSIKNLTSKGIVLKTGTVMGKVEAANAVPPVLAPKPESVETKDSYKETETKDSNPPDKCIFTQDQVDLLISKLDLEGIKSWSPEEQKEVKDLIIDYGSLFALKYLDLGKQIKLSTA